MSDMGSYAFQPSIVQVVTGPPPGRWTYADWERLPKDGNRYEVIDGVLFMTTAPHSFHQWIVGRLHRYVGIPAEDQGLALSFMAPIGVLMPNCSPVQPDYVVVLKGRIDLFQNGRIVGVPDLLIEVLSPSNAPYDREIKRDAYGRAGVPEYAIIDPQARTLALYALSSPTEYGEPHIVAENEAVRFTCLPTISFTLSDLFSGAPDTTQ